MSPSRNRTRNENHESPANCSRFWQALTASCAFSPGRRRARRRLFGTIHARPREQVPFACSRGHFFGVVPSASVRLPGRAPTAPDTPRWTPLVWALNAW